MVKHSANSRHTSAHDLRYFSTDLYDLLKAMFGTRTVPILNISQNLSDYLGISHLRRNLIRRLKRRLYIN